ncbi:MAG: glycerophosphodiester phosphodiesterase family protein, partial [Microbacterium sp.]
GDPRRIAEVPVVELEGLMADRGGLITLDQALDSFPGLRFNLDAKAPGVAPAMGRAIVDHGARVLVASFSDERRRDVLAAAAAAGASQRPATSAGTATIGRLLAALLLRSERLVARALTGIDALQIPERHGRVRVLTPRLIEAAHRHAVEVHVWTVNAPTEMRRLVDMGVDGIVTDRADVALETLR